MKSVLESILPTSWTRVARQAGSSCLFQTPIVDPLRMIPRLPSQ